MRTCDREASPAARRGERCVTATTRRRARSLPARLPDRDAADGERAIVRLRALRSTGVPVAMVLADLAVQPDDGIDLLARPRRGTDREADPAPRLGTARRAGRDDRLRATSQGVLDTVLTKPTGPRDEEFHGTITEELGEWAWSTTPTVEAVRVVVDDDARRGIEIRDLLERLGAPTGRPRPRLARGAGAGGGRRARIEVPARRGDGAHGPRRSDQPGDGRGVRCRRRRRRHGLRPRHRRGRSGGPGRRGVRRVGGADDADHRAGGVRWAGGDELDDPQLPRLPRAASPGASSEGGASSRRPASGPRSTWGETWSGSNPATRTGCACPTAPSPPPAP